MANQFDPRNDPPPVPLSLMHYGVKGMKWGVRKSEAKQARDAYKTRERMGVKFTSKKGESVELRENDHSAFATFALSQFSGGRNGLKVTKAFDIDVDGVAVGKASMSRFSKDELHLGWLGVDQDKRGNGYGSAVFDSAVEYGRKTGAKKLTLQVPEGVPDARHIYDKRGFKVVNETNPDMPGFIDMELDLRTVKHSEDPESDEIELALAQTFPEWEEETMEHSDDSLALMHYGVKGMKWGVRKAASDAVSKTKARSAEKKANRSYPNSSDHERTSSLNRRAADGGVNKLSNKELQDAVKRMNLEQQYRDLQSKTPAGKRKERGRKALVDGTLDVARETVISAIPGGTLARTAGMALVGELRNAYGTPNRKKK